MPKRVSINTAGLNKAIKDLEKKIKGVSLEIMQEVAEKYVPEMQEQFDDAIYDGEFNVKVSDPYMTSRSVRIEINGSAWKYIEYGTGVESIAPRSKGKTGWVFRAKGRQIKLNSGDGKPARYVRPSYTRYYYVGPRSHKRVYVDPFGRQGLENSNIGWSRDYKTPLYAFGKGSGLYEDDSQNKSGNRREQAREAARFELNSEVVPERKDNRKGYYFTHGNPPNYIIADAKEGMYQDIYKRLKAEVKAK